jgi:hypothetical protein
MNAGSHLTVGKRAAIVQPDENREAVHICRGLLAELIESVQKVLNRLRARIERLDIRPHVRRGIRGCGGYQKQNDRGEPRNGIAAAEATRHLTTFGLWAGEEKRWVAVESFRSITMPNWNAKGFPIPNVPQV